MSKVGKPEGFDLKMQSTASLTDQRFQMKPYCMTILISVAVPYMTVQLVDCNISLYKLTNYNTAPVFT